MPGKWFSAGIIRKFRMAKIENLNSCVTSDKRETEWSMNIYVQGNVLNNVQCYHLQIQGGETLRLFPSLKAFIWPCRFALCKCALDMDGIASSCAYAIPDCRLPLAIWLPMCAIGVSAVHGLYIYTKNRWKYKKRLCVRLHSEDKHHLRKSADRKAQIRKAFVPLTGLICAFRSADFLRWCLSSERNLTHNLFFYFQ